MSLPALRSASRRVACAGPSTSRCISTSSAVCAPKKKKKQPQIRIVANPDAMPLSEAVRTLRALEIASPTSSFSLEVITKVPKATQILRGRISLPTDPRKVSDKVLVLADGSTPAAQIAREAGATWVGGRELFDKILTGEIQPTKVLATPGILPEASKSLARFLGTKGLMPATKRGTVADGQELGNLVKSIAGTLDWKGDRLGMIRIPIARMSFTAPMVEENVRAFLAAVRAASAAATAEENVLKRGKQTSAILRTRLDTTNGPSLEINDA